MFRWLQKLKDARRVDPDRIVIDGESACRLVRGDVRASFRWGEVVAIHAWKEDLFAVDLICMGFEVLEQEHWIRLHEEMDGYQSLVEGLVRRYPDLEEGWWSKVAFPAFVPNQRVIWQRGPGASGSSAARPDSEANASSKTE